MPANLLRKNRLFLAAGLVILVIVLLAGFLWRPITINENGNNQQIRAAVFTTGQALFAAGVHLSPDDQVVPALNQPVPLDGQIHIRRAVQIFLWDAGQVRPLSGLQTTAAEIFQENGVETGPGDRLLWDGQTIALDSSLPSGRPILLQLVRAQAFVLDENGQRQKIISSAPTAARALWEAGVRLGPGDLLSIPPGSAPGAAPLVAHRTARALDIQTGGKEIPSYSTAQMVGQALTEAGVTLQGLDYSQPAEDQPLPADGKIRIVRVREEITLKEDLQPFEQKYAPDPTLEIDQRSVLQPGQYGVKVTRERARFEDGKEISRAFDSDWTASEPVPQMVGLGSKVVPKALDTPDGQVEYWRAVHAYATSYWPCVQGAGGKCSWSTSSGVRLQKGVVAVTLSWYRQLAGQRVYIPGYGFGVIGDVGGGIPGTPWIDLGFGEENANEAFVGWVTMYLLTPAPPNASSWNLP